jgi:hypothetical protein
MELVLYDAVNRNKVSILVPYDAVDRNKVSIRQLVFIFLLSHYMFRPLRAILK